MRKRKYIFSFFVAVMSLVACSESLEDTYSEYAGDGKIRYVAKCFNVFTTPGWERLILSWENGSDATKKSIKVKWTFEEKSDSVLLPSNVTTYELKNLVDGTYRFDICAMDSTGNESLGETTYGRPYTRDHEVMRAFPRGVLKSYLLKEKFIFFSDKWNENIEEMILKYKDTKGNIKEYVFDKEKGSYDNFITIEDVSMNPADTIYMFRKGKLENSPDLITFDPLPISRVKNYSAGFLSAIEQRYGYSTSTKEKEIEFDNFINTTEVLEFDRDIETFEDILYCPNIKKLIFGKNRYVKVDPMMSMTQNQSKLQANQEKSRQVLDKAHELLGLTIDCYGEREPRFLHYFPGGLPYMTLMGVPTLPEMELVTPEELKTYDDKNKVICSPPDPYAILNNLVDDKPETQWATTFFTSVRTYEMQMELEEETTIRGFKIAQIKYTGFDIQKETFSPSRISIQTSVDGGRWDNVTFLESNELGRGPSEVTLLPIAEGSRQVRYIKFTLRDGSDVSGNCMIKLGDFLPYK